MLKNLKVRTKLAVVLAVPLLALLAVGAVGVIDRRARATEARQGKQLTELLAARVELVHQAQLERLYLSTEGPAASAARQLVAANRDAFFSAVDAYRSRAEPVRGTTSALREALAQSESHLDALRAARSKAEQGAEIPEALRAYATALDGLDRVGIEATRTANSGASAALSSLVDLAELKREVASLSASATAAISAGFTGTALDPLRQRTVLVDEAARRFLLRADVALAAEYQAQTGSSSSTQAVELLRNFLSTSPDRAVPSDIPGWLDANASRLRALRATETLAANTVGQIAASDEANSVAEAKNFALGVLAALLASLLLASLVARSIARPLSRLAQHANQVATTELPALIEQLRSPGTGATSATPADIAVQSNDEVGQLARAINSIQGATRTVAAEQSTLLQKGIADIFASLARRNQTLLERQISFIDHLEAAEEDPDQLQNLFRLDHLATRMRRNAESLLVLAGADATRRRGRPVPIADVVRIAIGEVEHFTRIKIVTLDDITVQGVAAADLAHLLAELMENGTQFSPPDTNVEIAGLLLEDGAYQLVVTDSGIGMSGEQRAQANRTIVSPPTVGLHAVRSLGFTVIGRLAQRHGFAVRLDAGPEGGTIATVTVPVEITKPADPQPARVPGVVTPIAADDIGMFDAQSSEDLDLSVLAPAPESPPTASSQPARRTPVVAPPIVVRRTPPPSFAPPRTEPVVAPASSRPPLLPPLPTRSPVVATHVTNAPVAAIDDAALEGLTRRIPRSASPTQDAVAPAAARASQRSPEEIREMLSRYRSGLRRGRTEDGELEHNS